MADRTQVSKTFLMHDSDLGIYVQQITSSYKSFSWGLTYFLTILSSFDVFRNTSELIILFDFCRAKVIQKLEKTRLLNFLTHFLNIFFYFYQLFAGF